MIVTIETARSSESYAGQSDGSAKAQLPLNALRTFEVTARNLSATKAAIELGVTQGAVSQQIRRLEELVGTALFERSRYRLRLTYQGELLAAALGSAFSQIDAALIALSRKPVADQTLKVMLYPVVASKLIIPRLLRFQRAYPHIEVQLTLSARTADFDSDPVDVAMREGLGDWPGMRSDQCLSQFLIPVCDASLLERQPINSIDDLKRVVLLHSTDRLDDWALWLSSVKSSHQDFPTELRFSSSCLVYAAAAEGKGVAMAQFALVHEDLRAGRLIAPFSHLVRQNRNYYLVARGDRANVPTIAAFREWLLAEMNELEGELEPRVREYSQSALSSIKN